MVGALAPSSNSAPEVQLLPEQAPSAADLWPRDVVALGASARLQWIRDAAAATKSGSALDEVAWILKWNEAKAKKKKADAKAKTPAPASPLASEDSGITLAPLAAVSVTQVERRRPDSTPVTAAYRRMKVLEMARQKVTKPQAVAEAIGGGMVAQDVKNARRVVRERVDALSADAALQGLQAEHRAEQAKKQQSYALMIARAALLYLTVCTSPSPSSAAASSSVSSPMSRAKLCHCLIAGVGRIEGGKGGGDGRAE